MYIYRKGLESLIQVDFVIVEGETLETKVERIISNKEPIKDGAPLVYTDRKDGVMAGYDIRTDRFEVAVEAMDTVNRSRFAERDNKMKIVGSDEANVGEAKKVGGTE
jgi:hypothetical protein